MRMTRRGYRVLLHRLQESGLRLRWGAVDLVGQDHMGEDRAFSKLEYPAARRVVFLEQLRSRDVARHQIGRELHAREAEVERLGDGLDEQRLREARNANEQDMPARQQRRDEVVDDLVLANDAPPDLLDQRRARARQLLEELDVV